MGHKMIVNMLNIVFRLLATWEQVNFISSSDDVIENYKKIMAVLSIFEKKEQIWKTYTTWFQVTINMLETTVWYWCKDTSVDHWN